MSKVRKVPGAFFGVVLIVAGCSKADTERLARVARRVADNVEAMGEATNHRLHTDWQSYRASLAFNGLEARVASRLRWDKGMAQTPIQVEAKGAVITLKGVVPELSQRRRAVEIAESTLGVEQVVDLLQGPTTE